MTHHSNSIPALVFAGSFAVLALSLMFASAFGWAVRKMRGEA